MLRCYRAKKLIVAYLYDELDEQARTQLEAHLDKCPRCAAEVATRTETLQLIDRARQEVDYPERFEHRFPAMVRARIEMDDREPTVARPLWAPSPLRQAAVMFCTLLLGILIGSSTMVFGGLRSAHYRRLVNDARQLKAVRNAIESERVLDQLVALKVQLAEDGKVHSFAKVAALENVLVDVMPLSDAEQRARYLARNADSEVAAGNFAEASRMYEELIESCPESPLASDARQMVAFIAKEKLADYPEAVRQYEVELARAEQRETTERMELAAFDLAETCLAMGEYDKAVDAYWSLVERFPTGSRTPEAMLKLGDLYFERFRDFGTARELYYQLASGYGGAIDEMGVRARVETRLAMLDQSGRYGFKPVELFVEAASRDDQRAFALYEKIIHMYPNTVVAKLALDELCVLANRPELAPLASIDALSDEQRIEALRAVIARCRRKDVAAFAHMAIGDIFRDQIKDFRLARREYQYVLDRYPEYLEASEAQSRINRLVLAASEDDRLQS